MLTQKKAMITGGTSGIGKEIALVFAKNGADVAILGTHEERAKKAVEELKQAAKSSDQKFTYQLGDISKFSVAQDLVNQSLQVWDSIDILVNNAGITRDSLFLRMKEEDWDLVLEVNLKSVFNMCKALSRSMVKSRKGKIINISSVIGLTGNIGQVNYAASKSAIFGLTKSLAKEWANLGKGEVKGRICVNCIAPGYIQTPMTDNLPEAIKTAILGVIPMGQIGSPSDVAEAALFFASDRSNYITGQILAVDGGMTMR